MSDRTEEQIFGKPATILEAPCGCSLLAGTGSTSHTYCPRDAALRGPTSYVRQVTEDKDSLEYGTPGKEGAVKIYTDFGDAEATRKRIDKALAARAYMVAQAQGKGAQP